MSIEFDQIYELDSSKPDKNQLKKKLLKSKYNPDDYIFDKPILYFNKKKIYYKSTRQLFTGSGTDMNLLDSDDRLRYFGDICNGKIEGRGIFYYPNGNIQYEGNFSNDKAHGYGVAYFNTNKTNTFNVNYAGNFFNGLPHGRGTMLAKSGAKVYSGIFKNGRADRRGKFYYQDVYTDKKDRSSSVLRYDGQFYNGMFNGIGLVYYKNGMLGYRGELKNGLPHGHGSYFDKNGVLRYRGDFKRGKFHGIGTLSYSSRIKYEGEFIENKAGDGTKNRGLLMKKWLNFRQLFI